MTRFILTLLTLYLWPLPTDAASETHVGIIKAIDHPALTETEKGVIEALAKGGIDKEAIACESAQGKPDLAIQIAQRLVGNGVKVIVTIGTMPSQMALSAVKGGHIPIIFASVSDPVEAKLTSKDLPLTGVSNFIEAATRFKIVKQFLKKGATIGVIYNPGEANSVAMVKELKAYEKQDTDIHFIFATADKTCQVGAAAEKLADDVDAILVDNDNTALSAFSAIVKIATSKGIPVLCSDVDMASKGAFVAVGPNQRLIGTQAGEMALEAIESPEKTKGMPFAGPKDVQIYLNFDIAKDLKIEIPEALKKEADVCINNGNHNPASRS